MEALCRLSYSGGIRDDSNVLNRTLSLVLLLTVVACGDGGAPQTITPDARVIFDGGAELQVAVAESSGDRRLGLMRVEELPDDHGMAFVWEEPTTSTFWMQDTPLPLSIAFADQDGAIVTILEMEPCREDPCPRYEAAAPYVLAVEANAGWFADNGVAEGDRARLVR
jgi:uncharacterized protein